MFEVVIVGNITFEANAVFCLDKYMFLSVVPWPDLEEYRTLCTYVIRTVNHIQMRKVKIRIRIRIKLWIRIEFWIRIKFWIRNTWYRCRPAILKLKMAFHDIFSYIFDVERVMIKGSIAKHLPVPIHFKKSIKPFYQFKVFCRYLKEPKSKYIQTPFRNGPILWTPWTPGCFSGPKTGRRVRGVPTIAPSHCHRGGSGICVIFSYVAYTSGGRWRCLFQQLPPVSGFGTGVLGFI